MHKLFQDFDVCSEVTSWLEYAMLADEHFRRVLTLERQRSERSRKPFLLMLLDTGDSVPSDKNRKLLEKILAALFDYQNAASAINL